MSGSKFVIKNGKVIPESEATVSILNKSMFFGFAVYESIKVVQGRVLAAEYHAERLINSAAIIGLEHHFTISQIVNDIKQIIQANGLLDSLIRILLIGPEAENKEATLWLFSLGLTFYPDKFYRDGVKVVTYKGERFLPKAKTNNLLLNYLAYREALNNQSLDALLVNNQGEITEGTRSNIFAIKNNQLISPPRKDILDGMANKILIESAQGLIEYIEEPILESKLADYDALLITSTSMGVMPVSIINNQQLYQYPQPIVKDLMAVYKRVSEKYYQ